MRWIYFAIIVLFLAAIIIFVWQNFDTITISFLNFRIRAPLALLAAIIYALGAATGGSLFALLRRSYQRVR